MENGFSIGDNVVKKYWGTSGVVVETDVSKMTKKELAAAEGCGDLTDFVNVKYDNGVSEWTAKDILVKTTLDEALEFVSVGKPNNNLKF